MIDASVPALRLLEWQVANLFRRGSRDRLIETNEEPPGTAPRLFVGRTTQGNRWWTRADLSEPVRRGPDVLCAKEEPLREQESTPVMRDPCRALLAEDGPITLEYRGPAFVALAAPATTGQCTLVTTANASLLSAHFASSMGQIELCAPVWAMVKGSSAVAICFSARRNSRAAEAGVETVAAYRRCGYGTRVVAAWATAVQAAGLTPFYGTTWDNTASRGIAERLGFRLFAENWHFT